MSIWKKILEAQKGTGWVAKNGRNDFHKYDYATEADILTAVKSAALEAGLIILTSTTSEIGTYALDGGKNREGYDNPSSLVRWAKVVLSYQIVDSDTGEKVEGTFDGYAEDKNDKAIYKAMTGANKYFLMKFFGIATGDDPEKEDQEKEQTPKRTEQKTKPKQMPIQSGEPPSPSYLKVQINKELKRLGLNPAQASIKIGIPNIMDSQNSEALDQALQILRAEEVKAS